MTEVGNKVIRGSFYISNVTEEAEKRGETGTRADKTGRVC